MNNNHRMEIRLAISELEKKQPNNLEEFEVKEFEIKRLMKLLRKLTGV